jgi:hypothetical protein
MELKISHEANYRSAQAIALRDQRGEARHIEAAHSGCALRRNHEQGAQMWRCRATVMEIPKNEGLRFTSPV